MRLLRVGPAGAERPAALLPDGRLVDISDLVPDIVPTTLAPETLQRLELELEERGSDLPRLEYGSVRIGSPVNGIGKIVCIGLNYHDHARETGAEPPAEPVLFFKAADTVVGPYDTVLVPRGSEKTDWEVELAVVIGRTARYLDRRGGARARRRVRGRARRLRAGVPDRARRAWDKGKNCETFNPLGPWLVTADEVPDPQALRLKLWVNGELKQDGTTADQIFPVAEVVRYVSQFMTLYPGDVINTGTPAGVGAGSARAEAVPAGRGRRGAGDRRARPAAPGVPQLCRQP